MESTRYQTDPCEFDFGVIKRNCALESVRQVLYSKYFLRHVYFDICRKADIQCWFSAAFKKWGCPAPFNRYKLSRLNSTVTEPFLGLRGGVHWPGGHFLWPLLPDWFNFLAIGLLLGCSNGPLPPFQYPLHLSPKKRTSCHAVHFVSLNSVILYACDVS